MKKIRSKDGTAIAFDRLTKTFGSGVIVLTYRPAGMEAEG